MKAGMWRKFEVEAKALESHHMIGPATDFCLPNAKSHDEKGTIF